MDLQYTWEHPPPPPVVLRVCDWPCKNICSHPSFSYLLFPNLTHPNCIYVGTTNSKPARPNHYVWPIENREQESDQNNPFNILLTSQSQNCQELSEIMIITLDKSQILWAVHSADHLPFCLSRGFLVSFKLWSESNGGRQKKGYIIIIQFYIAMKLHFPSTRRE
jgi:hypothetical protein